MNKQKGFAGVVVIIIVIVAIIVGGAYVVMRQEAQAPEDNVIVTPPINELSTSTELDFAKPTAQTSKVYSLSDCGVTLVVKNNQPVQTKVWDAESSVGRRLIVGGAYDNDVPGSDLHIQCTKKNQNPKSELDRNMNDVSYVLSIQSDGSSKVDKNLYAVFDEQTLVGIKDLYSAKNRGYRSGSETLGFSTNDWIYELSFLNPSEARNQNSFIISVK